MKQLMRMMSLTLLFAAPALAKPVKLTGAIQFWERSCTHGDPGLPRPTSEKIAVDLELAPPTPPYSISTTSFRYDENGNSLVLRFFYTEPREGTPYISGQSHLVVTDLPIAECSQFGAVDDWFFPVGFCAGYVANDPCDQRGVTFYKSL